MPWIDSIPPAAPVVKAATNGNGVTLKWTVSNPSNELMRFAVYRFAHNEPVDLGRSDRIVSIQQGKEFTDSDYKKVKQPQYVVTALDRLWNESTPSNRVTTP
jgi:hypothetical protein